MEKRTRTIATVIAAFAVIVAYRGGIRLAMWETSGALVCWAGISFYKIAGWTGRLLAVGAIILGISILLWPFVADYFR